MAKSAKKTTAKKAVKKVAKKKAAPKKKAVKKATAKKATPKKTVAKALPPVEKKVEATKTPQPSNGSGSTPESRRF